MMVRVNTEVNQKIIAYAEEEQRSVANMVRVLLNEALRARAKEEFLESRGEFHIEPGPMPEGFKLPKF
jgi:hypothetical protein